jgi:hypothetical protein
MQGSPSPIPSETDIVEIGDVVFNHQPSVNNEAHAKGLVFGSAKAATLTLAEADL